MKYCIILIPVCILSLKGLCQINDNEILKKFLSSEEFCKFVLPCNKCDTITLVDTAGYFGRDSFSLIDKWILIKATRFPVNFFQSTNEGLLRQSCNSLLITKYLKVRRRFCIEYFHYPTNGVGYAIYKIKNGKLKQVDFSYGQL